MTGVGWKTGARAAIVCLGLACGLVRADVEGGADAGSPGDPIPSRLCRNLFFVPVTLAERPEYPRARTLWFVYDTGNNHTVVDPESVERVSGRDLDGVERVTFTDATTGPVTWNRLPATLRQLDHLSLALGVEIDGILAYRDFGEFLVTLDYELGELRLSAGRLPEPDGETVFDARGTDERPWLDVTFLRGERRMLIDSGANGATLSVRELGRYATQAPPRASGAVLKINRVERSLSARAAGEVLLGAFALPAPVLDETRGTELIGAEVMRHFHWTFDPVRQRVRIERRTAASMLTFDPLEDHGLVLVPETEDDTLRVHEVIPGTAAAETDVRPGDRIVAIDGRPVRARGCDWAKGRAMALTLDRDGERLDVAVPMTRFVD